jgi:hypothetical protein
MFRDRPKRSMEQQVTTTILGRVTSDADTRKQRVAPGRRGAARVVVGLEGGPAVGEGSRGRGPGIRCRFTSQEQ